MNDSEFNAIADKELARLAKALENSGADIGVEMMDGGMLEVEFVDGSKMIINRQSAAQEIWVAAPQHGGFHFRLDGDKWMSMRLGLDMYTILSRILTKQERMRIELKP